jgi:hypothetical protein
MYQLSTGMKKQTPHLNLAGIVITNQKAKFSAKQISNQQQSTYHSATLHISY